MSTGEANPLPAHIAVPAAHLAVRVREACLRAALDGYEQAGIGGLCAEGRWEMALDAIRSLDLDTLFEDCPDV